MIRALLWGILWILSLCSMDIDVTYVDGLHIHYKNVWRKKK